MIYNDRQLKTSKSQIDNLFKALEQLPTDSDDWLIKAQRDALQSQLSDIKSEVADYEIAKEGRVNHSENISLYSLPKVLIHARIGKGLSQKDLAEQLGMSQQQIQRYEASGYMGASLARLTQIAEALEVTLQEFRTSGKQESSNMIYSWENETGINWNKFPIKEMIKRGSFTLNQKSSAISAVKEYFNLAAGPQYVSALHRKKFHGGNRPNEYSLLAWQARVLEKAKLVVEEENIPEFDHDERWVKKLVSLSMQENSPIKVKDFLASKGVVLVTERHLSGTYLDGAAMLLDSGNPVVALTLRHDRLDNFWFVLMHELGHVFLHLFDSLKMDFFDEEDDSEDDELEREADNFALDNLISSDGWNMCLSRFSMTEETVRMDAENLGVHPSIVAGRIRKEYNNYTILGDLLGTGSVRYLFEEDV